MARKIGRHRTHRRHDQDHRGYFSTRHAVTERTALNKFLNGYDWDDEDPNLERLEELQRHDDTCWSNVGRTKQYSQG